MLEKGKTKSLRKTKHARKRQNNQKIIISREKNKETKKCKQIWELFLLRESEGEAGEELTIPIFAVILL